MRGCSWVRALPGSAPSRLLVHAQLCEADFALGALSDAELENAISSEAADAGFDVGYDTRTSSARAKRKALQRLENEGGATAKASRTETQRRIDNDTDGTRRRDKATKDRHRLI